jgi:hypothetical protein
MTSSDKEDPYILIDKLRSDNIQAGEYGLKLLNDKSLLESQYKDLASKHELFKLELEELKLRLKTVQANQREETLKGETNEETLLNEKYTREEYLIKEITRNKHELRSLKHDNEHLHDENEKILLHGQQLTEYIHEYDQLKVKLKYDLKESKIEEQRLIDANTELEEHNVTLHQQVEKLKESLINYDVLKHENKQLQESVSLKL